MSKKLLFLWPLVCFVFILTPPNSKIKSGLSIYQIQLKIQLKLKANKNMNLIYKDKKESYMLISALIHYEGEDI